MTLDPGSLEVRVQARGDKDAKTPRIRGTLAFGAARRLYVDVGRLRGKLSLAGK